MIVFALGIFGLIFGSFVSALTYRMHEQDALRGKKGSKAAKRRRELSMMHGRSLCPHCGHVLAAKDLVPVLSWLWLRGRCRYCHARIPDTPVPELLTGLLFGLSYAAWPYGFASPGAARFTLWLAVLVIFVALTVYDMCWSLLPDRLVFPLTGIVVVQVAAVAAIQHSFAALWLPAAGGAVLFGLFWLLFQVSKGAWIGGGDVKLALALGMLAGTPYRALIVIFFASLIGTVISIPQLLQGRQGLTKQVPFGPPLMLATYIVVLWGGQITSWYQHLFIGTM